MVQAPGIQLQKPALLFCPHERAHPGYSIIEHQQLHTRHRTLFPTILTDPAIHQTVHTPVCNARQLSHFLSLFPHLDLIIGLQGICPHDVLAPDTELALSLAPRLRGQLSLGEYGSVEAWTDLVALGGALQFRYIELIHATGLRTCPI
jgi:hypothetical protein